MESIFQTKFWAEFKQAAGWRSLRSGPYWILARKLGPLGTMIYAPEINWHEAAIRQLLESTRRQRAFFYRLDFWEAYSDGLADKLKSLGLVKAFEEVQPEYRQWVDLSGGPEAVLVAMKPKGRYNINIAIKHGLQVTRGGSELVKTFTTLYKQTAERQQFSGRGLAYFERLVKTLEDNQAGEVIIVRQGETPLAAAIISYHQGMASYLYGASSQENRELMAPYLMHWVAMQEAIKRNCRTYDLLAVAPPDQPDHRYANLTRFKNQFGGRTVRLLGSWDLVKSPIRYMIYRLLETRRRRLH